jgi:hypothetical protein
MLQAINVSITGADTAERELMSNVITNALVKEGYSNVALVNTVGEPMVGSDVQSLADVLRKNHPEFLDRTVRVWSIPVVDVSYESPEGPVAEATAINCDGSTLQIYLPQKETNPVLTPQHQGYSSEDFTDTAVKEAIENLSFAD